jgi:hypothetical protein
MPLSRPLRLANYRGFGASWPLMLRFTVPAILLGLAALHLKAGELAFTGDEPHYAFSGLRFDDVFSHHSAQWNWARFLAQSRLSPASYGYDRFVVLAQSALVGVALGPSLLFGLAAGRWCNFCFGCLGLVALASVLNAGVAGRKGSYRAAALTVAIVAFSFPLVAYMRLLYPEVLLFTAAALALRSLLAKHYVSTALLAVVMPLIHARALPLSVAFVALILLEGLRERRRAALWSIAIYGALEAGVAVLRRQWPDAFGGTAFPTYQPQLDLFWWRAGLAFFDVRHGLLAYAPIYLIGFAGLIAGALKRNRACIYCALLFLPTFLTFMWSNAGDSWTARFWVLALPFLAVGLTYWFASIKEPAAWTLAVPSVLIGVLNAALLADEPEWFLENRRASLTYQVIYKLTHVFLGSNLPIDKGDNLSLPAAVNGLSGLTMFSLSLLVLLVLVVALPARRGRLACTVAAGVMTLAPLVASLARDVPVAAYTIALGAGGSTMVISFSKPPPPAEAIVLDDGLPLAWNPVDFPDHFILSCDATGTARRSVELPSRPVIVTTACDRSQRISVEAIGDRAAIFPKLVRHVTVLQSLW